MTTATATKFVEPTWTDGLPPIPENLADSGNFVYLLDNLEWDCPALVHWAWNTKQQKWYLYFHDTYLDDQLGPRMDQNDANTSHGYRFIYLYNLDQRPD